tara:strand:+ start:89 stop:901 length:813 start_codon:yes stop_codon:yes gene_type:complete
MDKLSEKNIYNENFSQNKNVLLLIGHLRTIKYLLKYHKKFLKNSNSDLIISTWTDDEIEIDTIDLIKKKLKPIYFEFEEFNFNLTADIFGNLNKFDMMFGKASLSTRSQIYKFIRSAELVNQLENLQNKKYEIIFKSRPDLFFFSNINTKIPNNIILFENSIGDWNYDRSDRFFYGHREIFFKLIKVLKQNAKKAWSEKSIYPVLNLIPLQEQFIKYCTDKDKIICKSFLPIIRVWRPNKEPDIKSISKIFLYMLLRILKTLFHAAEKKS